MARKTKSACTAAKLSIIYEFAPEDRLLFGRPPEKAGGWRVEAEFMNGESLRKA